MALCLAKLRGFSGRGCIKDLGIALAIPPLRRDEMVWL